MTEFTDEDLRASIEDLNVVTLSNERHDATGYRPKKKPTRTKTKTKTKTLAKCCVTYLILAYTVLVVLAFIAFYLVGFFYFGFKG